MSQGMNMIGPQMPGSNQGQMDPMMNNQPLQFNPNKGKPPMAVMGDNSGDRMNSMKDSVVSSTMSSDGGSGGNNMMMSGNMMGNQGFYGNMGNMGFSSGNMGNMSGNMGNISGNIGNMGNMMSGPMMGDPNMMMNPMMYNQFGSWGPMGQMAPGGPGGPGMGPMGGMGGPDMAIMAKEIIHLKSSVLYPPPPGAPPPTTRERPPGCRTVFVGGLPENVEENMIVEIFEHFGNICSLRKGKKNFAHIRYEMEDSVDRAIFISGYRMKIEDKDDKPNTGRLHVDYAMARDDQYEFECKQRMLMRELRHQQMLEEERLRPPSPPPVVHYSDHEAQVVMEKLKNDDDFVKTSSLIMTWLERGDLTKRNVNVFYSMLQCLNSHVRRLLNEKQQQEEELQKTKERFKQIFQGILHQFDQIERVFGSALKQRNWDHFSKPQRKNLELWNKQTQEIKQQQQEEFLSERVEDEMEMSDNDESEVSSTKKRKTIEEQSINYASMMAAQFDAEQLNTLKEDNDSLRCQLEAYKNEVDMVKQENTNNLEAKEKEMKMLRQALQGMQQQLIQAKQQASDIEKARELEVKQLKLKVRQRTQSEGEKEGKEDKEGKETDGDKKEDKDETKDDNVTTEISTKDSPTKDIPGLEVPLVSSSTGLTMTEKQAKLIGLISCFLHVHPTGASVDYIWSYLSQLGLHSRTSELEDLLDKLPMLFKRELSGVGATIERRWQFIGYKTASPLSFLM